MWVSTGDLLFCINVKLNLWRFVRPMTVSVLSFGSTSVSSMLAGVEFLLAMQPMSICCSLSHHLRLLDLIFQSGTVLTEFSLLHCHILLELLFKVNMVILHCWQDIVELLILRDWWQQWWPELTCSQPLCLSSQQPDSYYLSEASSLPTTDHTPGNN